MVDIKNTNVLVEAATAVATEIIQTNDKNEKDFLIPGTQIKLFVVIADSPRADVLNKIPGAFLGIHFSHKGKEFLIFRRNK